jgi:hypothetical protein
MTADRSLTPKLQSEELMNSLLTVAEMMLKEYREFYPYGGYMDRDGRICHVGVNDPDTEYPKSQDMIDILESTFREMAREKKCKAVAIVVDVRVTPPRSHIKTDAIQVSVEHVDNYSVQVFFPYSLVNDELAFGETFACRGEQRIFGEEEQMF